MIAESVERALHAGRYLGNEARYLAGRVALAIGADIGPALKIFVIGTGRSGTHWLGHALERHPDIHAEIEAPPVFGWTVEMARRPERERDLFPRLIAHYRAYHALVAPRHLADKSHPNIWLAEKIAGAIPEARFIGVRRKLFATVASMLRHPGVRHWVEVWDEDPRPDRFLGVTDELLSAYRRMSVPARCAVRVVAHSRELERLAAPLGPALHVIDYETLQQRSETEAAHLTAFLALDTPIRPPPPDTASLERWKGDLAPAEIADIRAAATLLGAADLLEEA